MDTSRQAPPTPVDAAQARPLSSADREALARDLANAVAGEVRFDAHNRMLYATDASLYQVEPLGVVIPRDTTDATAAVDFCGRRGVPILPRGGGTSLAGQCTNRAVVLDLSPNCRRILEVDAAEKWCRVEPGITVDDLNDELARMRGGDGEPNPGGLFFAPDPATARHANIGGCIGNNAAGARSILYGRTSESLLGIDACLIDGTRVRLDRGAAIRDPRVMELSRRVLTIVRRHAGLIRERFPKTIRRNAGYALDMILAQVCGADHALLDDDRALSQMNLAHLLCGSEGTLAVTLGAQLLLHDRPKARGLAVLGFDSLEGAIDAVNPILTTSPSAVELLDDTVIDLARANVEYARYVELMPQPKAGSLKAVLYVEYFDQSPEAVARRFDHLAKVVGDVPMQRHTNAAAMLNAWKLRKAGEPLLHGVPGHRKPITFVEDNAIPVENLPTFVRELKKIVAAEGTFAAFYAHASVGVLHVRPLIDIHDADDRARMRRIAVHTADLARSLGGVMSGEHGDGRVRGPLLERFFGPELMGAFREVKAIFDPQNLLNPGNIVEPRAIESMTEKLRVEPAPGRPIEVPSGIDTYFDYADQHGFDGAVEMCNGAGVCRKKQGGTMCPSYMGTLDERHSTRGRGNALRLAITGQLKAMRDAGPMASDPPTASPTAAASSIWADPGTIQTLNLCLSCKACKTECPSNVDIARLKAEYTAQRYREHGAPVNARIMGAVRTLNRLGAIAPGVANALGSLKPMRSVINAVLGFDARRSLPQFAPGLSGQWEACDAENLSHPGEKRPKVVLFGDCFVMYNEPGIGLATKRVFEACGYEVVLADAGCCARAKISMGLLEEAIDEASETLDRLMAYILDRSVVAILVAEPSCLSAIKDDWMQLKMRGDIQHRRMLAGKAWLPEHFLDAMWDTHPTRPKFNAYQGEEAMMLHGHCHQKALWGAQTSAGALSRIPNANVRTLDTGCCGMAGSFGYTKDRYDLSMKIGELALFPAVRSAPGATVAAPGTSCRHQVHDGCDREAKHPIQILADHLAT